MAGLPKMNFCLGILAGAFHPRLLTSFWPYGLSGMRPWKGGRQGFAAAHLLRRIFPQRPAPEGHLHSIPSAFRPRVPVFPRQAEPMLKVVRGLG